jgi:branched-chain amino acid transport system permease protein
VAGLFDPMGTTFGLSYSQYHYFLLGMSVALLAVAALVVSRVSASPFGRLLRAVRDDEQAVAAYGRSVLTTKFRAYLLGATLAGLAGGVFAAFLGALNPSAWSPVEVLTLYAGVLVGGRGNVKGVILGTFVVYIGFLELTRNLPAISGHPEFAPALRQVLVGLLIVLFLRFRPQGLIPERLGLDRERRGPIWRRGKPPSNPVGNRHRDLPRVDPLLVAGPAEARDE